MLISSAIFGGSLPQSPRFSSVKLGSWPAGMGMGEPAPPLDSANWLGAGLPVKFGTGMGRLPWRIAAIEA